MDAMKSTLGANDEKAHWLRAQFNEEQLFLICSKRDFTNTGSHRLDLFVVNHIIELVTALACLMYVELDLIDGAKNRNGREKLQGWRS